MACHMISYPVNVYFKPALCTPPLRSTPNIQPAFSNGVVADENNPLQPSLPFRLNHNIFRTMLFMGQGINRGGIKTPL